MAKTQEGGRKDKHSEETSQGNGGDMTAGEDEDEALVAIMKHRGDCKIHVNYPCISTWDNISA